MGITTVLTENTEQIEQSAHQAGEVLRAGGLVVFPTETVYGIAASAASEEGLRALRVFKERPADQPFTVHLADAEAASQYADVSGRVVQQLLKKVFPGPVTLVLDVAEPVIAERLTALGLQPDARDRLYHANTVGLRCPDHPVAQRVIQVADVPIVASSANRRGQDAPVDGEQAVAAVGDAAGYILDGGRSRFAKPSTIVRVSESEGRQRYTVERAGVYDQRYIQKLMRWTVLFVCSGNTCRSPMAEALARHALAQHAGVEIDQLETAGVSVGSAGAYAGPGTPASEEAVRALDRLGIDLSRHRSRPLTPELVHEADAVFCMTESHVKAVLRQTPTAASKTYRLDPDRDIDDPIGSDLTRYQRCAEVIRRRVEHRLKELGRV